MWARGKAWLHWPQVSRSRPSSGARTCGGGGGGRGGGGGSSDELLPSAMTVASEKDDEEREQSYYQRALLFNLHSFEYKQRTRQFTGRLKSAVHNRNLGTMAP